MIAQMPHVFGECGIVGRDEPSISVGAEILGWIKTESCGDAE